MYSIHVRETSFSNCIFAHSREILFIYTYISLYIYIIYIIDDIYYIYIHIYIFSRLDAQYNSFLYSLPFLHVNCSEYIKKKKSHVETELVMDT